MVINIAATGRFHVLDLARELDALGHDVRFYSYVPIRRCRKFGLPSKCCVSLLPFVLLPLALIRVFPKSLFCRDLLQWWMDFLVGHFMRRCDVFIGMSGIYLDAFRRAKKRFGALTVMERGSTHVKDFYDVMKCRPGAEPEKRLWHRMNGFREIAGYESADHISIASGHVRDSFIANGLPESKLWINPYGVDVSMFKPTVSSGEYDVIMVGTWSFCKGADRLEEACKRLGVSLLHVGSSGDIPYDEASAVTHTGVVDQRRLPEYYAKAKIFALHSREEGLALVQVQAMACGLPIVCSQHTGGRDLRKFADSPEWIVETRDDTVEELMRCLDLSLKMAEKQSSPRCYFKDRDVFSWRAYARRYEQYLEASHDSGQ